MTVTRYSNNANIKYPLSDFHEESVPNDILLNLSINVPEGYIPVVSVLQVTPVTAFLAIEDYTTKALLASVLVDSPTLATVYPMTMDVEGSGYVVMGPGLTTPYNSGHVSIPLDPDTVTYSVETASELQVKINDIQYPISNILRLLSTSSDLNITIEDSTVFFDRNDSALTQAQINGFVEVAGSLDSPDEFIMTIAGVSPDASGNIDILFRLDDLHPDCPDIYTMTPRRTLEGKSPSDELPLDELAPRDFDPDYECVDPVIPPPDDPSIGPQTLKAVIILDKVDDNAVGVLYSTRGSGLTPGVIIDGGTPGIPDPEYNSVIDGIYPDSDDTDYESVIENNGQ